MFILDDAMEMVCNIIEHLDVTSITPPKRILSTLNFLGVIFTKLMNKLEVALPSLIKLLLSITAIITGALQHKEEISSFNIGLLKDLRTEAVKRFENYFNIFEDYLWSEQEIKAVFHVAVWPVVERLPDEGVYSPTVLLKLFSVWTQNPRYSHK